MSALFGVSNFAVTTAASKSAGEARLRTLSLYRKRSIVKVPEIVRLHELDLPSAALRAKIREQFEQHRYVEDLSVKDVLIAKGQMEYQETMNVWKQTNHIMNYFAKEEAPPKPTTFLEKFYEGRS
ncbi:hypothetical protein DFQ30_006244 [Apophysomyces sp. BC1015]|nr:hypothetical protein DFQ30_006244 [Apophysomyces sp. BC1015]